LLGRTFALGGRGRRHRRIGGRGRGRRWCVGGDGRRRGRSCRLRQGILEAIAFRRAGRVGHVNRVAAMRAFPAFAGAGIGDGETIAAVVASESNHVGLLASLLAGGITTSPPILVSRRASGRLEDAFVTLIPTSFLFRIAYPCVYVKDMPGDDDHLVALPESCRL